MRWFFPVLALSLFACAGALEPADGRGEPLIEREDNPSEPAPTDGILSYAEAAPIIAEACAGCHQGKFDTLDKVKAKRDRMKMLIERGAMPRQQPTWKDSDDGKLVLKFLAESPELQ